MKLINKLLAVTAISVALVPGVVSADCGKARLADFDWSSANIHTAIAGFILEHGYGCDVSVTKEAQHLLWLHTMMDSLML